MSDGIIVPPVAGWLWFLERQRGGTALDASAGTASLAAQLGRHFASVERLDANWTRWAEQTFDCIALHDRLIRTLDDGASEMPGLTRLYSLLRPGGWLVGGSTNPDYIGVSGARAGVKLAVMTRKLRLAGFREIRCVFATPSLDHPTNLIPDARKAVRAFETSSAKGDSSGWSRRAVAGVGPIRLLYPAYFAMARR